MNILKVNEDLKLLSDQQLAQSMQAPTGIPQYAIAAELNRRKTLRQQAGPQKQSTVVQDLISQTQPSPIPMGEAIPQGPPPGQAPGGGIPYGAAIGMSHGGRVPPYRMAGGGNPPSAGSLPYRYKQADGRGLNWRQISKLLPGAEWGQRQQTQGWTPVARQQAPQMTTQDFVSAILPVLQEREEKVKQYEDGSLNRALMQAGFAMMASKDPTAFGGIGAGLQQGLAGWTADKAQTREEMSKLAIQRASAAAQQQQRAENEANRTSDWARGEQSVNIVDAQNQNSYNQSRDNLAQQQKQWEDMGPQREANIRSTEAGVRQSDAYAQKLSKEEVQDLLMSDDPVKFARGVKIMETMKRNPDTAANTALGWASLGLREKEMKEELEQKKIAKIMSDVGQFRESRRKEKASDLMISMNPAKSAQFDAETEALVEQKWIDGYKGFKLDVPEHLKTPAKPTGGRFKVDLKTGKFSQE